MKKEQMFAGGGQNLKTSSNPYGTKKEMIIATIFSVLLVALFVVGITYAVINLTGMSDQNLIKSGKISMSYAESSNVINLTNALPISDADGMMQSEYFDFSVSSNVDTNADDNEGIKIPYNLIIEPKAVDSDKDALTSEQIKVYLTKIVNGSEKEVLAPIKISELRAKGANFNLYSTKNIHNKGNGKITTEYRLRAWIDYEVDASTWSKTSKPKQYKFKINVTGTTISSVNLDKSGANHPLLTSNMIPVYYDESDDKWKKANNTNVDEDYKWYDYDNKMWANAVTVSETNRNTYLSGEVGTPIPMEDINAMFVWVPRYKYTYFKSSTPVEIPITFEKGTASTGTINCESTCTDTINGSIIKGTSTYTHPAFTFGDEELTGIWIGKFENSGGNTIAIRPDVQARAGNLSEYFKKARNMEIIDNEYGFSQNGTTLNIYTGEISGDSNNIDSHLMKSMDWGAVEYLSHSKYGKNSGVYINNSERYYTGRSGGNVGGSISANEVYPGQTTWTGFKNDYGFYTYDGYLLNYDTNEKSTTRDLSKIASTTGNIYGIYDMSGGGDDNVMANFQSESKTFIVDKAGTWDATNKPLEKYYDRYLIGRMETNYSLGKLGDGIFEIQEWYGNYASYPHYNYWLVRGGCSFSENQGKQGIFSFGQSSGGGGYANYVTRTVLTISN